MIQDTYQESYHDSFQLITTDKGKWKEGVVQYEEVFLYKPYDISLKASISESNII